MEIFYKIMENFIKINMLMLSLKKIINLVEDYDYLFLPIFMELA